MSKRLRSPLRAAFRGRSLRPRAAQTVAEAEPAELQPIVAPTPVAESPGIALPTPVAEPPLSPPVPVANAALSRSPVAESLPPPADDARQDAEAAPSEEPPVLRIHVVADEPAAAPVGATASRELDPVPPPSSTRNRVTLPDAPPRGGSQPELETRADDGAELASAREPDAGELPRSEQALEAAEAVDRPSDPEPTATPEHDARASDPDASIDDPPEAQRARPVADERELDLNSSLSLSSEFFRKEEDSVPPLLAEEELDEPILAEPPSPATLRRRRAFRGVVGAVIAVVGVCAVAVVAKTVAARPASASVAVSEVAPLRQMPWSRLPAATAMRNAVAAAPEAQAAASEPATTARAEPAPAEAAKPEETAKPAEPPAPTGDAKELRKEALNLLNRGKMKDAIPVARAAIAADPTEAMAYLYLGSALQDTGKWKDGIEAYSECVRNATKGPVHECRAMGGRK